MRVLINSYFDHIGIFFPFIHRPSFERSLYALLHMTAHDFGCVVLTICAIGARYSDDPRAVEGEDLEHFAGWRWFKQVKPTMSGTPSIYDLQLYVVSTTQMGSSPPSG
jgi:hypothetical protein